MKYVIGEKVRVIATKNVGTIREVEDKTLYKTNKETNKEEAKRIIRYLVNVKNYYGAMSDQWIEEEKLEQEIILMDEQSVDKVLIDVALFSGNFEMAKSLSRKENVNG